MNDVLVLDKNWQPVATTSWENSVKLIWEEVADVVESDASKVLHSPSFEMNCPLVIKVRNSWARHRKKNVPCSRRNILIRDHAECQYCGTELSTYSFTIDHVVPQCQGGKTLWSNVVACCEKCNRLKSGRTPEQAGVCLSKMPCTPDPTDRRYTFRLSLRKVRPEWQHWLSAEKAPYLYWNADITDK